MIIQKRRINNIETYMKRLGDIEQFYICVKNCSKNFVHMARPNGRFCGAKRPKCEAEQPLGFD